MAYRIRQDGVVECDTAEELKELARLGLIGGNGNKKAAPDDRGSGIAESWARARELADREGISVKEARSRLKKT